jgi:WD repeat-containing protein 61
VDLNKRGNFAVTCSLDSRIRVFDVESSKPINVLDASPADAWTLALSPDGRSVAAGGYTGRVRVWSVETGRREGEIGRGAQGKFAMSVRYSPNGRLLAAGSIDGFVNVWDTQNEKMLFSKG